jgi:hypothetical protein
MPKAFYITLKNKNKGTAKLQHINKKWHMKPFNGAVRMPCGVPLDIPAIISQEFHRDASGKIPSGNRSDEEKIPSQEAPASIEKEVANFEA